MVEVPEATGGARRLRPELWGAAALVVLLFGGGVRSDEVTLKNGKVIRCMVLTEVCRMCGGGGMVACPTCGGRGMLTSEMVCPRCAGRGKVVCPVCGGKGFFGDELTILARGGIRMSIPFSDVVKVVRGGASEEEFLPPAKAYERRLEKMDREDPGAHFELGKWALEAGLPEKAELHFLRARQLDGRFEEKVLPFLERIRKGRERMVEEKFRNALDDVLLGRFKRALAELETLISRYPESALLRTPSLQKRLIEDAMGLEATRWGTTADEVIEALREREAVLCPVCDGSGVVDCPECNGTGDAVCPACRGTGRVECPDCNGTGLLVCPTCFGRGSVERNLGFAAAMTVVCPTCGGRGAVPCRRCSRKGWTVCPECGGRRVVKHGCKKCGGSGKVTCPECRGTGLRAPGSYDWGPYEVFPALEKGRTPAAGEVPAFQARCKGAVITLVAEKYVYGGRLAALLDRILGEDREYFLLCVDNAKGGERIRLGRDGRFVRMVSPGAEQESMMPPGEVFEKVSAAGADKRLLATIIPDDVLPGAVRRVLCVFPSGVSSGLGYRVFFGEDDVVEMDAVAAPSGAVKMKDYAVSETAGAKGR